MKDGMKVILILIIFIVMCCSLVVGVLSQQPKIRVLKSQVTRLAQVIEEGTVTMRESRLVLEELRAKLNEKLGGIK